MRRSHEKPAGHWVRSLAPLIVFGLLAVGGCSDDNAQGDAATSNDAAGQTHQSPPAPSPAATPADQVEEPDGTSASGNGTEPGAEDTEESSPATGATVDSSDAPVPTAAEQPEPALSDEEIRETYGADAPEPAESMLGTLCNLNGPHLEKLSAQVMVDGTLDDQMLRLAALSLSDDLAVWEGLAWQLPDAADEIDVAREIYAHWEFAVGLVDAGDPQSAIEEWNAAGDLIDALPAGDVAEVGC